MKRNLTSLIGALHPVFFLLMIYVISFVMAFFVCTTIYNSLHSGHASVIKNSQQTEAITALK